MAMSLMYHHSDFNDIREFEESCRVPMSFDQDGEQEAGYRDAFPDFRHFVPLLPPIDAADH